MMGATELVFHLFWFVGLEFESSLVSVFIFFT